MGTDSPLRKDIQRAKLHGIDISCRGWRKRLKNLPVPDAEEEALIRDAVTKRDGDMRLRRLSRKTPEGEVPYGIHPESEISGELYFQLRLAGVTVKLEVSVPSELHRSGLMRVDMAVFDGERITDVIECKSEGTTLSKKSQQALAYAALRDKYGIKIHFVNSAFHVQRVVALFTQAVCNG